MQTTRTRYGLLTIPMLLARMVPRPLLLPLSRFFGTASTILLQGHRQALLENLTPLCGSRRRAAVRVNRTFIHYTLYLFDYLVLPFLSTERAARLFSSEEGIAQAHRLRSENPGRGVILITPHFGHWELGGIWLSHRGIPLHVLSLQDQDEGTERLRQTMRAHHGIRLVRYDPSTTSLSSMMELLEILKGGGVLAMLTDRAASQRTATVPFFGRPTPLPIGPFLMSWLSHAIVLPSVCVLQADGRYLLHCDPPILLDRTLDRDEAIRRATAEMARRFETFLRRNPDQWYNFFPYWNETQSLS